MNDKHRHPHKWEELFPEEFFAELQRAPIVYWTCGCVEEHGAHLTMVTDLFPTYNFCLKAAAITGGIVYPIVPFAPAGSPPRTREQMRELKTLYPPSLFVSAELCHNIYLELLENMADLDFKICVALGGHGPAIVMLDKLRQEYNGKVGNMKILTPNWTDFIKKDESFKEILKEYPKAMHHSGILETAAVMKCAPMFCDLSKVHDVKNSEIKSQTTTYLDDTDLDGVSTQSTLELGDKIFKSVVDNIVNQVNNGILDS